MGRPKALLSAAGVVGRGFAVVIAAFVVMVALNVRMIRHYD